MKCQAIILAAGKGTRMKSSLPKVLHALAGQPLLAHVMNTATAVGSEKPVIVIGHGAEQVKAHFPEHSAEWVIQAEQLGTGHAVQQALPFIEDEGLVLVLYGDVPLILPGTLKAFAAGVADAAMGVLTFQAEDPTGYGRIIKANDGGIEAIVEEKDASDEQRKITEVNSGIYLVRADILKKMLPKLSNDNAQGEYLLTDLVELVHGLGETIKPIVVSSPQEVAGINDRTQLAALERYFQRREAERLMKAGATLSDPARFDLRGHAEVGRDVFIDVNVVLEGQVTMGDGVSVGANCVLRDVHIGPGTVIAPFSHIEDAIIGADCQIGPFARIRPGSRFAEGVKVGNFVETKKANVGQGSKINHLSYVGDATLGERVNVGAGTITCNYDGVNKFQTVIEDDVFVGSNTALVAPIKLGEGATIAAGSTIVADAPSGKLTLGRARQKTHDTWQRPEKK